MASVIGQVLVTGGAGFIGSHSVEKLLDAGHRVRVLDNLSSGKRDNLPFHERLEFLHGDIRDTATVRMAMQGMSHCLHLAAQVSVSASVADPINSAQHNIIGALSVMQAAAEANITRLVYASSAAIYGMPTQLPLGESSPAAPLSPYGLEKWVNERYATLLHELTGLSSLGLRYFNVYGPRQDPASPYAGVIARFLEALQTGQSPTVFGDGQQSRDFIYVADVAHANFCALFDDHQGVCNVATGQSTTLLTLLERLAELTGIRVAPHYAPARIEDIRHSLGDPTRLAEWLGVTAQHGLDDGLSRLIHALPRHPFSTIQA